MKDDEHAEKGEDEEPENFDEEVVAVDDKPGPELRRTERCGYPQLLVPTWERRIQGWVLYNLQPGQKPGLWLQYSP